MFEMALLAVNVDGQVGAGSTFGNWRDHVTGRRYGGFPYAVATAVAAAGPDSAPPLSCAMRVCATPHARRQARPW